MSRRIRVAASLVVASMGLTGSPARADSDAVACARASESAQSLRSAGKLVEALDRVPACLHLRCPDFVRRDCETLRTEVQASLPTIVVHARGPGGEDATDVRVLVDGAPFLDRLDGRAKPVDPGPHTLRFEMSGVTPIEKSVVVREGEKMRVVDAAFVAPSQTASPRTHEEAAGEPSSFPWPAAIVAGAGVVALGAFAYLGLTGLSDLHGLQSTCGVTGSCAKSEVDPVRTKLWVADGLGVAGVVTLGVAGWLWFSSKSAVHATVTPTAGGARAVVALSF
jgi:hypothetical protein